MIQLLSSLHQKTFGMLEAAAGDWLLGLLARLTFASTLLFYFLNSAQTKVGSGFPGFLIPSDGAYIQMLPPVVEAAGYDTSQISFFPYGLIVWFGTYAEFILPVILVLGLFTRLAALGMMGFIAVMTYVDINFHHANAKTIGGFFDRIQDSAIADQRLLWLFPLIYLLVKGPGLISLDGLLGRLFVRR